MVFLNMIEN